mmetsp:Transcript_116288/g.323944  ORF Transcript_116288/g.323944 Transcript_116288/m.323944 type:complete len:233 (-) Transcript_116288:25-723(-)
MYSPGEVQPYSGGSGSPRMASASRVNACHAQIDTRPSGKVHVIFPAELLSRSSFASPQYQSLPSGVCHKLRWMSGLGCLDNVAVSSLRDSLMDCTTTALPYESSQQPMRFSADTRSCFGSCRAASVKSIWYSAPHASEESSCDGSGCPASTRGAPSACSPCRSCSIETVKMPLLEPVRWANGLNCPPKLRFAVGNRRGWQHESARARLIARTPADSRRGTVPKAPGGSPCPD